MHFSKKTHSSIKNTSFKELIKESKILEKQVFSTPKEELYQDATECLSFILKMKNSELIHIFRLDDEEKELAEEDIECAILKTFLDCNKIVLRSS